MQYFKQFIDRFRDFARNETGNYALIFALAMPAVLGAFSVAIETSAMMRHRAQLQVALDAAALATGKQLAKTVDADELSVYARNYFEDNLHKSLDKAKTRFAFNFVETENTGKRIRLKAYYDYPEIIGLLGFNEQVLGAISEVTAGNRTVEVAIVIDNSGSMSARTGSSSNTRIQNAREAAKDLATQLFALANISNKPNPVRISIVPFASSVNVGANRRGKSWMDNEGWSSIHHENIAWNAVLKRAETWPDLTEMTVGYKGNPDGSEVAPYNAGIVSFGWLSRWTLYDALNTDWDGCVEMRPWPYHTTDAVPSGNNPDTLFVPMFAPDEPNEKGSNEDDDYSNNYLDDYRRTYANSDGLTYRQNGHHYLKTYISGQGYNYGNFTRQHWRQDWAMKYNSEAKLSRLNTKRSRDYGKYGPNMMCTTNALQPLTKNINKVMNSIDAMEAGGFTNVQAGISWGWRTLSENKPFRQGRDYTAVENDKYIIVLTDGNNTYPNQWTMNESQYTAWGYKKHGRVYDGLATYMSLTSAMNAHTATTCENIKSIIDGDNEPAYKIFTIAYDVADGSSVKNLLYNCASANQHGEKYYYDVSGDALVAAMQSIGREISELRLSR